MEFLAELFIWLVCLGNFLVLYVCFFKWWDGGLGGYKTVHAVAILVLSNLIAILLLTNSIAQGWVKFAFK